MKFAVLKSVAHNIAAAVSDGGWGMFESIFDIHGDASKGAPGYIIVDFLRGTTAGASLSTRASASLSRAPEILAGLCRRHGGDISEIAELTARFGVDPVYGSHFTVTVADRKGKCSVDQYKGVSGRRLRPGRRADWQETQTPSP